MRTRHVLNLSVTTVVAFAAVLTMFISEVRAGGPWPQEKGHGYAQLSYTHLTYHELIDDFSVDGGFETYGLRRKVTDLTLKGYLEYGVTDRLTAIASVPYKMLSTGKTLREVETANPYAEGTAASGQLNALGNTRVGLRYLLHDGSVLWSAQLIGGLKTASYDDPTGLRTGYDAWYATPRLQIGKGWGNVYFSASAGFRPKTNGYSDDFITDNEVGYRVGWSYGMRTWFILAIGAEIPVTEGKYDDRNSVYTGTYRNEEGFVDPGLKINHYFTEHLAFNASAIGAVWARHGGNEMTFTAGMSWDW